LKFYILFALLLCSGTLLAQKQGNIWYFGNYAGVDFNTSPPTGLTDGKLSTNEGCASIADEAGKLLFYTDGITVFNKQHNAMEGGTGLYGDPSSTQSGVIIPHPANKNIYYVFTVLAQGGSLYYSIVDVSKQSGLGEVIEKNTLLLAQSTEKITAVKHQNGQDIWVITHEYPSNKFLCYLITKNGLQTLPVISAVGTYMGLGNLSTIGYLKASPKGGKLAAAIDHLEKIVEIYDFNKQTGVISNPVTLDGFEGTGPYGIEFSPNEKFLYIAEESFSLSNLYQVKLPVVTGNISKKGKVIAKRAGIGALQIASDGKIYVSGYGNSYLDAIEYPNLEGELSHFKEKVIDLKTGTCTLGLPTFNQSFFAEFAFTTTANCIGDITQFTLNSSVETIDSLRWNFADTLSTALNNTSTNKNPSHKYADTGSYNVTLKVYHDGVVAQFDKVVVISPIPSIVLGNDTTLFYGQTLLLDAKWPGSNYTWNNGTTQQTYLINAPGNYSVTVVSAAGCSGSGSIKIKYDQIIDVGLNSDTVICKNETIKLDVSLPGASYVWSTGSTASSINLNQPGKYWVTITNAYQNRVKTDTINVKEYQFARVSILSNTILCESGITSVNVSGAKSNERYRWFNANKTFVEENTGTFYTGVLKRDTMLYVQLTNGKCEDILTPVTLTFDKPLAKIINRDTIITLGATVQLKGAGAQYYHWIPSTYLNNTDIADPISTPNDDITYQLIVLNNNGCSDTATIKIRVKKQIMVPNTFTPNGDGVNDLWSIKYIDRLPQNHVYIYNRSGILLRDMKNYTNDWDGTNRSGQPLPAAVYYYVIQLDEQTRQSGYVTIIR
jgi:gliding motility-associated-like protein